MQAQTPIGDYGAIGDGRSVALVSRRGSLDWLCWPRFDSPSWFSRLLDVGRGGSFRISPADPAAVQQRYVPGTNVLETSVETAGGRASLVDFMPADDEAAKGLWPQSQLCRRLSGLEGEVLFEIDFAPRPDFGRAQAHLHDRGRLGIRLEHGAELLCLRSTAPLTVMAERARALLVLKAGEVHDFSLTLHSEAPTVLPPLGDFVTELYERTVAYWRRWGERAVFAGPGRDDVVRSALALKLLVFAPSGAVVAAPTTSLPERRGGDLNWDYRFAWLRDAAMTARAFFGLGYDEEARAFVSWLLHATRLTLPELKILYDVYGRQPRRERVLPHLIGHAGARPVRIGNAAQDQLQLDVYGEVIDAAAQLALRDMSLDLETQDLLLLLGETVCRRWPEPDQGIWEPRIAPEHHTHSRVLCWAALDRLLALEARGLLPRAPREHYQEHRLAIRRDVEVHGFNQRLESFTATLRGDTLDAALLRLPFYGFTPAAGRAMQGTHALVRERLGAGPGLLYRYEPSREAGEGAFGICSFWEVELLARGAGSLAMAEEALAAATRYATPLGLYAEETEVSTGAPLGNFPQAYTHVGHINAALTLAARRQQPAVEAALPLERRQRGHRGQRP